MFDTYSEIFAERARSYHAAMKGAPRARDAEFRAVLDPLNGLPDGLLCDLPAGGCYLARHLRPGLEYVGVDPVDEFIVCGAQSKRRILQGQLDEVPLADGSVDYIVSLAGLHHEPDLRSVFREMRRLVRENGRVVISDVAAGTRPARFLNGFVARTNPLGHDGRFLDDTTAGILETVGFSVMEDELIPTPWVFATAADASRFARDLFGASLARTEEIETALAEDVGLSRTGVGTALDWCLRRIICTPASSAAIM